MGWTKRQFVEQALAELGLPTHTYDATPEQLEVMLRRLDAMMATWNAKGIRLGYPLPSSPDSSDLDAETGVPDAANEAIYANLATRSASSYGKMASPSLLDAARQGYSALLSQAAVPPPVVTRGLPAGAGNKPLPSQPFLNPPAEPIDVGGDGHLELY